MRSFILTLIFSFFFVSSAQAVQCKRLHIGYVNWSDVEATTALAEVLLEQVGYRVRTSQNTVPGTLEKLANQEIDVFLGNWMPSNEENVRPFFDSGKIIPLTTNLTGAKYTLAVPSYVYDAGVKNFADLAAHRDKFGGRIFGLESGNDGNLLIQDMISKNAFGLKDFKLMASSERIMLAQLKKRIRNNQWMAFLAWEPHPMNVNFDIRYLEGGDDFFGPNLGESRVETLVRSGFEQECPQAAELLKRLTFTLDMENSLMADISENFSDPKSAAWRWIAANPQQVNTWLTGLTLPKGKTIEQVIAAFE